ncbi:hypothetical protein MTO96_024377 [Rhipicephalus appendiculatus]
MHQRMRMERRRPPPPTMKTERTSYLRAVGTEDFRGHGESVKMKPPKLPLLYFQISLCCATKFTDTQDASLAIKASEHRRLQRAVRLPMNVIDYAPAHAYGTATASAPHNENGAHKLLKGSRHRGLSWARRIC